MEYDVKKLRFTMMMAIIRAASKYLKDNEFEIWVNKISLQQRNNERNFDELYAEAEHFINENYDLLSIYIPFTKRLG